MNSWIRPIVVLFMVVFASSVSVDAQGQDQPGDDGTLRLMLGVFNPTCASGYWDDSFDEYTGSASDFDDLELMMDDLWPLSNNASLLFSLGWYEGAATQGYRDWLGATGEGIRHKTSLRTIDATVGLSWHFGDRQARVRPYVAAGGGYLWWKLSERGQFIDFEDPERPIIDGDYSSSSGTFSLYALLGLEVRVAEYWSLAAHARYREADDELGSSLAGAGNLDLSGYSYSIGLAFLF